MRTILSFFLIFSSFLSIQKSFGQTESYGEILVRWNDLDSISKNDILFNHYRSAFNNSHDKMIVVVNICSSASNKCVELASTFGRLYYVLKNEVGTGNDDKIFNIYFKDNFKREIQINNDENLRQLNFYEYNLTDNYFRLDFDSIRSSVLKNPMINKSIRKDHEYWSLDFDDHAYISSDNMERLYMGHVLFNAGLLTEQGDPTGSMLIFPPF